MAEQVSDDPTAGDRSVRPDPDAYVLTDGRPDAPAVLLLTNAVAHPVLWDPVVAPLAAGHRVVRVGLRGDGRTPPRGGRPSPRDGQTSSGDGRAPSDGGRAPSGDVRAPSGGGRASGTPAGYDVPSQARRVAATLDGLGVDRVTVVGHSSGGMVATALAEQRPDLVVALALVNAGPDLDAEVEEPLLVRLLRTRFPGRLLWGLRTEAMIRNAARTGFTRPVDIPEDWVRHMMRMPHRDFSGTLRGYLAYLGRRGLPDRLRTLGLPVLVLFGADDQRWRSSSAAAYRVVPGARVELLPGVGHTPMMEDPETTGRLLLDFIAEHAG